MRAVLLLIAALFGAALASAQTPPIESFTREHAVWSAALSPNGRYVAVVNGQPDRDTIYIVELATGQARSVQSALHDQRMRINWVDWKSDDRLIFSVRQLTHISSQTYTGSYLRVFNGADVWVHRIFSIARDGGEAVAMFEGQSNLLDASFTSVELVDVLPADLDHILLAADGNGGVYLWRADIGTGHVDEVDRGGWMTDTWFTDANGIAVLRRDLLPRGSGYRILRRGGDGERWTEVIEVRGGATANLPDLVPLRAAESASHVYVIARPDMRDRTALYSFDAVTGAFGAPLFEHASADLSSVWMARGERAISGACAFTRRLECTFSDASVARHFAAIETYFHHDANVALVDMSLDGQVWLLAVDSPTEPMSYFIYDRAQRNVSFLSTAWPELASEQLGATEVFEYRGRDGAALWGYLTTPRRATGAVPLIVLPHGGPEARDEYGFDPFVQFLVSRGYAVFQPQFRGSGGFGRAFADAGRRGWGGRMQDDVTDGVRALVDAHRADPARMCIVGISYGGYAALVGAALTPDLYRCAISMAGVSDLLEFLRADRAEDGSNSLSYDYWVRHMGDPRTDRDALIAASPRRQAAAIRIPVLLIHGDADSIVPVAQSDIMARALQDAGKRVQFLRVSDADHPFRDWTAPQLTNAYAEIERFLAANLGPQPAN